MKLEWKDKTLLLDGSAIKTFEHPVRGVLSHNNTIIVLLNWPKTPLNLPPEMATEINRNVYGLDPDGTVKWRIRSHGSPDPKNMYYVNLFLYIAQWGETLVLYTGDGPNYTLNPVTGETERLSLERRNALFESAKAKGLPIISSPSTTHG
jgi:hypothetical protein